MNCFLHHTADLRLFCRFIDSTISQLPTYKISSLWQPSVVAQPGLCRTWSVKPGDRYSQEATEIKPTFIRLLCKETYPFSTRREGCWCLFWYRGGSIHLLNHSTMVFHYCHSWQVREHLKTQTRRNHDMKLLLKC